MINWRGPADDLTRLLILLSILSVGMAFGIWDYIHFP
jgi:hypothetical protein